MAHSRGRSTVVVWLITLLATPGYAFVAEHLLEDFANNHQTFPALYTLIFGLIISLLLLDALVRIFSRFLITMEYGKGYMLAVFSIVMSEYLGLAAFSLWARSFLVTYDLTFSDSAQYYGLFCIAAALHNFLSVVADKDIPSRHYLSTCLVGDPTTIEKVRELWGYFIVRAEEGLRRLIGNAAKYCANAFGKENLFEDFSPVRGSALYLISVVPGVFALGAIRTFVQFATLHLFFLNLTAGVLIALSPWSIPQPFWAPLVWILLICGGSSSVYYFVSYRQMYIDVEKERQNQQNQRNTGKGNGENGNGSFRAARGFQKTGNLVLLSLMIMLYLSLSKNVLIWVIFGQQTAIAIMMLIQLGPVFFRHVLRNDVRKGN